MIQFDPVEIKQIAYYSVAELMELMKVGEETFCHWFVQIIQWAIGKPSEVNVLKIHNNVRFPWLQIK